MDSPSSTEASGGSSEPGYTRGSVAHTSLQLQGSDDQKGATRRLSTPRRVSKESLVEKIRKQSRRSRRRREPKGTNAAVNGEYASGSQTIVLSGQPTGWTAMAQAVRNFDEEKVKDCKEDVDTLLVFAGLFSAVLTAFLIESYKNLLPDPASQTLFAIRQLVVQTSSYQFQGAMLNSTAVPLAEEPFRPSALDIRVNALWFASLLCSLITASFGILVKQWLREFLAAENPSPLARLRVRHLRYPQLVQWKVFEIAAVLPLLLQLSLSLFFAGLCYFTASIHASVEYTTLPLVFGWAFCFCAVTALPLFFPLCPYRTALLKGWFQSLHRNISSLAKHASDSCRAALRNPKSTKSRLKRTFYSRVGERFRRISGRLAGQDEIRITKLPEKDIEILASVDSIQSNDELLGTAIAEAVDHLRCGPMQFEEFLRTILEHRGHRSGRTVDIPNLPDHACVRPFPLPILNLRCISKQARNAICSVVSHYVANICFDIGPTRIVSGWCIEGGVYKTILMSMIMISASDCPLPEDGLYVLRGPLFRKHGWHSMCLLIREALDTVDDAEDDQYHVSEDKPSLLVRGLGQLWGRLNVGTDLLLRSVFQIIAEYERSYDDNPRYVPVFVDWGTDGDCRHISPLNWIEVDDWNLGRLPQNVTCDLMGLVLHGTAGILRNGWRTYIEEDCDFEDTFRAILRLSYFSCDHPCNLSDGPAFDFVISTILADFDLTRFLVDALLRAPFPWIYVFASRFPDRLATLDPVYGVDLQSFDWCTSLGNFTAIISAKLSETNDPMTNVDALKLCYFASSIARFIMPVQPPREQWHSLFNMLLDRIDGPHARRPDDLDRAKASISDHMIQLIAKAEGYACQWTAPRDGDDKVYGEWANKWKDGDSVFPDRLIESIAPYAPKSRRNASWRIRRALETRRTNGLGCPVVEACSSPCSCLPNEWDGAPVIHHTEANLDYETWHGRIREDGISRVSGGGGCD